MSCPICAKTFPYAMNLSTGNVFISVVLFYDRMVPNCLCNFGALTVYDRNEKNARAFLNFSMIKIYDNKSRPT